MTIKFNTKFSELQIDEFISEIHSYIKSGKTDKIYFDLTEIEWMSNQGLILFTGVLKYLIEKEISFEVLFIEKGISTLQIPERVAKVIIQIWEIYGIYKVIPDYEYRKYFGIDLDTIASLKRNFGIYYTSPELFGNYGITPFVCLNFIKNYDEAIVRQELNEYHMLNSALIDLVNEKQCSHPFLSNLFGDIISKEVYENFLDHAGNSFFNTDNNYAFFSLSLKGSLNEERSTSSLIQKHLENNFSTEEIPNTRSFFYNTKTDKYKNFNYISYSFLDFGIGIPNTLKEEYLKTHPTEVNDSEIIKFAFKHNTSRHPISDLSEKDYLSQFIPRGLFDVISLIQRYRGLLIVRSAYGKVLFNFAHTQDFEEAYSTFGNLNTYFPGTFFTIYLPAVDNIKFDYSSIKPNYSLPEKGIKEIKFISLRDVFENVRTLSKDNKYNVFLKKIQNLIIESRNTTTLFDFNLFSEQNLIKKLIYFLVSSYEINASNNVIILNPPDRNFLKELNYEVLNLSQTIVDYKIHPLPFVYFDVDKDNIEIFWLGLYDESDIQKLQKIIFLDFSLAKSDFNFPNSVIGQLNYFDEFGNFRSNFPDLEKIKLFFKFGEIAIKILEAKNIIEEQACVLKEDDSLFFCNGNYYQKELIELSKIYNNTKYCDIISSSLYHLIKDKLLALKEPYKPLKYIAVTSSSQKITDSLVEQGLIDEASLIFLENYHSKNLQDKLGVDAQEFDYILICDVLSTGKLVMRINDILTLYGCTLLFPAVIVDSIDKDFIDSIPFSNEFRESKVSLYNHPIKKFVLTNEEIKSHILDRKIIRLNPFTNIPIRLKINETNIDRTLLSNEEFLELINDNHIKVGFLQFNNIIHPYFFDTELIILDVWDKIFQRAFSKRDLKLNTNNALKIFYPKKSDIRNLDFDAFKSKILKNHNVEKYVLDRFLTTDGWNFPHTSSYLEKIVANSLILILDDGSCSGDSLTQMVNEVAFYKPQKIIVISLIGRISEHKREFLSTLNTITKVNHDVSIEVYFISHWHIPTYHLNENPNIEERNWLSQLIGVNNLPFRIQNIAKKIRKELEPATSKEKCKYEFLPIPKDNHIQPKKEFVRVRNEIGKVIGYRFYIESFEYFDTYMGLFLKSDRESKKRRVNETELLCAIIAYEPYLFEKLEYIVPDVTDKIKLFIKTIFFGNPSFDFQRIDISKLNYKWDKRDFLHLFFIIFKDFELVPLLKNEFLSKLINFLGVDGDSIYYILYKLMKYYPLTSDETQFKDSSIIQRIIDIIISRGDISEKSKRELKIFRSFTNTLPHHGSFQSHLNVIRENFRKNKDGVFHKNSADSNLDSMLVGIDVLKESMDDEIIPQFFNSWEIVSEFIEPILSFSLSYPSFFIDNLFMLESDKRTALRTAHGRLNKLILHLNEQSDFDEIEELLFVIQNKLLHSSSELYQIFSNLQIQNLPKLIDEYFGKYISTDNMLLISNSIPENTIIDFPEYYLKTLVFEEIKENLRYARIDEEFPLSIEVCNDNNYIVLDIINEILNSDSNGGGNGLNIFEKARLYPDSVFDYKYRRGDNKFHQKITLKKTQI